MTVRYVLAFGLFACVLWIVPVVLAFTIGRLFDGLAAPWFYVPVAAEGPIGCSLGVRLLFKTLPTIPHG